MAPNSRGFGGRRRDGIDPSRIPPGQYYERGFPVLSAAFSTRSSPEREPGAHCSRRLMSRTWKQAKSGASWEPHAPLKPSPQPVSQRTSEVGGRTPSLCRHG